MLMGWQACFLPDTREPIEYIRMKDGMLRRTGWEVVPIPFWEWDSLPSLAPRLAYLAGRLTRAGYWTAPAAPGSKSDPPLAPTVAGTAAVPVAAAVAAAPHPPLSGAPGVGLVERRAGIS